MNTNTAVKLNVSYSYSDFRISGIDKGYHEHQMQDFANNLASRIDCEVKYIHFGKQDSRGSLSITVFDHRHCVPMQRHFNSKDDLLGFIIGYNAGMSGNKYL